MLLKVLLAILVIWLAVSVIGLVFSALKWLIIVGAVVFVATLVIGLFKRKDTSH